MNPSADSVHDGARRPASNSIGEGKSASAEQASNSESSQREPVKIFSLRLPTPIENTVYAVQDFWNGLRKKTIPMLPAGLVNGSSNVIGSMQLVGEVLMMKSTGATLVPDKSKWYNYIIQPPVVIYETVFKKAKGSLSWKEMLRPSRILESSRSFANLERMAQLDSINHTVPLINRWTARSSFSGIVGMSMAMAMPEVKETPEQVESNAIMLRNNPIGYYLKCVAQGLWFPAETLIRSVKKIADPQTDQRIGEHKRQFAGIGLIGAGLCSVASGFRQVEGNFVKGELQTYRKNKWHIIGGLITTLAGNFMMTGVNSQQGWGNFGTMQMFRIPILYPSIASRFKLGVTGRPEDNRWWYVAAHTVFQIKNTFASLVGGAEVSKEGKIIDHIKERKDALAEADEIKIRRKIEHGNSKESVGDGSKQLRHSEPTTTITQPHPPERAMPERAEAIAQAQGSLASSTVSA
jgi:hypothetical protein